jgi:hypothetical protein
MLSALLATNQGQFEMECNKKKVVNLTRLGAGAVSSSLPHLFYFVNLLLLLYTFNKLSL